MLPRPAYGGEWKSVNAAGTSWDDTTSHTGLPGWIAVPAEHAAKDNGILKVSEGSVVEKTQGEVDSEVLVRTRATARSRLLSAVSELLASQEIKTRLNAAGKSETLIDARIAVLDTAITTALGNHP